MYYLGIDGGGTRTTAAVSDEKGNILYKSVGKTINFYSVGFDVSRNNLKEIMNDINRQFPEIFFESAFIGCSALDNEATEETISALCKGVINANKIGMNSDVYVALKSVDTNKPHCVAICGTGSMAVGEKENGETVVKGGWGHIIGDEGSAYSIAVQTLKKCCLETDRCKLHRIVTVANKYFGVHYFRDIIDIIYSPETSKDIIAGFASEVAKAAEGGVTECEKIIVGEAKAFADTVLSLLREIENCDLLSLYGGVFQHNLLFRKTFMQVILNYYPELKIEMLDNTPEDGALKIARKL